MINLGELQQRVLELEDANSGKPKDNWDRLSILSSLMVPILVAVFGGYLTLAQIRSDEAARAAEEDLRTRLAAIDDQNADLSRRIEERDVVASEARVHQLFIPHLLSGNDRERALALAMLAKFYPRLGEQAAEVVVEIDQSAEPQRLARKTISETLREPVTSSVELVGGWPLVRGDGDVDTDGGDVVPVSIATELKVVGQSVVVDVTFRLQEYRGDGTQFAGTQRHVVYTAPNDRRILFVEGLGGTRASFQQSSIGQQHGFQPVSTSGTYWNTLSFRVDSKGSDEAVVGVRGNLEVVVAYEQTTG